MVPIRRLILSGNWQYPVSGPDPLVSKACSLAKRTLTGIEYSVGKVSADREIKLDRAFH